MKSVKVIFKNHVYNYETSVNPDCSNESLANYFVGKMFNVGSYPVENMQQCIRIEIYND